MKTTPQIQTSKKRFSLRLKPYQSVIIGYTVVKVGVIYLLTYLGV